MTSTDNIAQDLRGLINKAMAQDNPVNWISSKLNAGTANIVGKINGETINLDNLLDEAIELSAYKLIPSFVKNGAQLRGFQREWDLFKNSTSISEENSKDFVEAFKAIIPISGIIENGKCDIGEVGEYLLSDDISSRKVKVELITALLDAGLKNDCADPLNGSLAQYCVELKNRELLLRFDLSPQANPTNLFGNNIMTAVATRGENCFFDDLVANGWDINSPQSGVTNLFYAIENKNKDQVKHLILLGAKFEGDKLIALAKKRRIFRFCKECAKEAYLAFSLNNTQEESRCLEILFSALEVNNIDLAEKALIKIPKISLDICNKINKSESGRILILTRWASFEGKIIQDKTNTLINTK